MHSTFRKLNFLIAFGAFFAALSLSVGCTNLFSSNSPNNDAPAKITAKEGYGIITGSVPAANSVSPRTAMPDPDKTTPDEYKVFAQNGSTKIEANVNQATKTFSIQLPYGTWNVTAQGLNAGKVIYSETRKVTLSAANSQVDLKFTLGYSTNPDDGLGETSLSVSFPPPSSSNITAVKYILSKDPNKIEVKISEEELTAGKFTIKRIFEDLGTYSLTINFYGDFGNLIYLINQKVQVYANLCTDKFVGNAPYISGGDIVVTEALLKEFENTTLYVNATTGNDTNTGTRFDPLKTFYRAVEMVNNASVEPAEGFRIFLQTDVSDGAFLELKDGRKLTVASSDGTARTIESLERQFNVASTSELTVNDIKFQKMSFRVAGTLEMNGCEISGNTKNEQGGAIHVANGGKVTITNSKLLNNEASNSGGAVYVDGGTFTIENCTISGNQASNYGGGVFVDTGGTFEMQDGAIGGAGTKKNTAKYGGGVAVYGNGAFTMGGGTISANNASVNGGGIYAGGGTLTIKSGAEISGNSAATNGGGVFIGSGSLSMSGGTITENKIEYSGAINASTTALYNGGGVYIGASGEFTMSGGTISKNTATFSGAIADDVSNVFNGGGVYVDAGGEFTMSDGEITGNRASLFGGGVSVNGVNGNGGTFTLSSGAMISANTANEGGGVHVSNGTFKMQGGTISGNEATNTSTAQDAWASGGGVFIYNGSFTMSGSSAISENKAKSGGGVYVTATSTFTMEGNSTISENEANSLGGGICISDDSTGEIKSGTINGNITSASDGSGGGVFMMTNATFEMTGGEINRNMSGDSAGGIFIYDGSAFTMSGGEISGNKAASNAGGVFVHKGTTFTMEAGTISDNTAKDNAGGVFVDVDDSTFTMSRGTISGNQANLGGGVYIIGDPSTGKFGTFTMENGTISGNTANTDGGGVYVENAVFTMENGTITENEAKGDFSVMFGGGGVYIVNTMSTSSLPTFTMKDGVISKNKANMGGGIYSLYYSEFTMSGGKFSENQAAQQGSGAYINNTSTFKMSGAAKFEEDDDVYLYGEVTTPAKITVTGTLEATSPVATITPSTYNEGREILTAGAGITKEQMQAICRQFALTPEPVPDGATEYTATRWGISPASSDYTKGVLGKVLNELYVSENGNDNNLGTKESPFKTMEKAIEMLKEYNDGTSEYTIYVHGTITPGTAAGAAMAGAAMADISGFTEPLNLTIQPFPEDSQATLNAQNSTRCVNVPATESGLTLTLENLVLRNGKASDNGGGVYFENGTFVMKDCEITGSEAGYGGGGVFVEEPATLTMTDCKVDGNKAQYGGGIFIDTAPVTMSGGTVNLNTAEQGAGVYVVAGTFTMQSDAQVYKNTASSNSTTNIIGGGVLVRTGGTLNLKGSATISENTARNGAGVYITDSASQFTMSGGTVSKNIADNWGGGIYISSGTFTMQSGEVSENQAIYGAGIRIDSGEAIIGSNTAYIIENSATMQGGGVYISGSSTRFTMSDGQISDNNAETGAGVYVSASTFTMSGSAHILNNETIVNSGASADGGGVYMENNATFTMSGNSAIYQNKGAYGGGVHIKSGTLTMNGGTYSEISGNTATGDGGGVYVASNGAFTMSGGTITGNDAQGNQTTGNSAGTSGGGGVYVFRSPDAGSDAKGIFTMTGGTITSNKASGSKNGNGVFVSPDGTFNMGGGAKVEANNDVYLNVYPTPGSIPTITVTGTLSAESPVATITPASYVAGRQVLAGSGVTITQDICEKFALSDEDYEIVPDGTGKYGVLKAPSTDIIYLNSSSGNDTNSGFKASKAVASLTKAIQLFEENNSKQIMFCSGYALPANEQNLLDRSSKTHLTFMRYDGSSDAKTVFMMGFLAILQDNLVVRISNVTIDGNKDNIPGNTNYLLYINGSNVQVTLGTDAILRNNRYRGVSVDKGKFILDGGEITGNSYTSSMNGAGVYVKSSGELEMRNGKISENTTYDYYYGGGVYVDGGTFTMSGGEISNNTAKEGGGVYVDDGTFTMSGGTIRGNKTIQASIYDGGGVHVDGGTFTMSDGEISENMASGYGGGVYVESVSSSPATFTMQGGKITKNIAGSVYDYGSGGGVYIRDSYTTFIMEAGEISENSAAREGGGVCALLAMFTMRGGEIKNNTAGYQGGGVYGWPRYFTQEGGTVTGNTPDDVYQ